MPPDGTVVYSSNSFRLLARETSVNIGSVNATDRAELRSVVREFMQAKVPLLRTVELMERPLVYEPETWQQMSDQLALAGLATPEHHGGQGFGFEELAVALEEHGRVVYSGPFFASALLAAQTLQLAEDADAAEAHLPALASGERVGTLALFEPGAGWEWASPATTATQGANGWRLNGEKAWVIHGAAADVMLVTARCEDGLGIFVVEAEAGIDVTPHSVLDLTRPLARIRFADTPAERLHAGRPVADVIEQVLLRATVGIACEQAGGAAACLAMTVEYVSDRIQFGRRIGSYQAVSHRCADMFVGTCMAEAVARRAARAIADGDADSKVAAGVAKAFCSDVYLRVADDAIQLHGGVGFTWEHPAHVFLKRAKSSALMFGDPAQQRAAIGSELLRGEA
jgi:alkylation response protein AidB-like acyl-CoA dehydrogenase